MNEINFLLSADFIYNSLILSPLNSAVQNSKKIISNIVTDTFTNFYNHLKENLQFTPPKLNISFIQPCIKTPQAIATAFSHIKKIFRTNQTLKQLTLPNGDLYLGELKNGLKHGKGKYTYSNGDIYEGDFKNDLCHGNGKLICTDGFTYEGEYQNDVWNGKGKATCSNGDIYEGQFKNGLLHGKVKFTLSNGACFEGEYQNNKKNGKGKLTYLNGDIYEGEFKNNLRHGNGKLICTNGLTYEGEYQNGNWDGKGKLTYLNGDIYEGEFKNNLRHGNGKLICSNGLIYEGEYQHDNWDGKGKLTYSTGDIYEGEFKNNLRHGNGKLICTNGLTYEGEYQHNNWDGKGKLTYSTGDIYEGEFKNNLRHGNGKLICSNGFIYEGEYQHDNWDGKGTLISSSEGLEISGLWEKGILLNNNSLDLTKIISQDFFFRFLLGKNKVGLPAGIWETIFSNILKTIKNPKIQEKANLLENTNQFFSKILSKETDIAAELILKQLQTPDNPCLIYYGCKKHAMGLLFTAEKDHFKITIFNSGLGLQQYHQKLTLTEKLKFKTKIDVLVPKENLTKDTLISILNTPINSDINDAYQKIFQLNDKNLQTSSASTEIWQAPQKGPNCSLEWIFAFLKNTLPLEDYIELRIKIFELALEGLEKNTTLSPEDKDSYRTELQRKIEKRKLKLENLH